MKRELKHVNFYRLTLLKGCYSGMEATRARTLAFSGRLPGSYISPMFDTGERGGTFHRLTIRGSFEGVKLEVIAAASDELDFFIDGSLQHLDQYLQNKNVTWEKKSRALPGLPSHERHVNSTDILLHGLRGRYIWICVALYPAGECVCELEGMRLELPKCSFTEYFPEIYQGNDFFDRYIAVFQSMFLDIERRVDDVPMLLDYRTTSTEYLEQLAGWLGIDNSRGLFTAEQLRRLIERIDIFQGAKGTRHALEEIVLLFTGIRPGIVEYFQWMKPQLSPVHIEINKRLYGESADHFCVILDLTKEKLRVNEKDLEQLIGEYIPLGTQYKVVYLRHSSHTDTHCYLDVNASLSVPEIASIDGGKFGGHITVG